MAHRIFGQRFMSRVEPAWHNLGIVFSEDEVVLPSEAMKRVAGDVHVVRRPLYYNVEDGADAIDSQHFAIVRLPTKDDPSPLVLGTTSERWHPISYPELAGALDKIDQSVFKVETCGLLSGGALAFLSLRGEDWSVLGKDQMRTYSLVNLSLSPGTGHRFAHVSVRVVCANTNETALAGSRIQLRIQHSADAVQQIGLAGDLVARYRKAQEETQRIFDVFASTRAPRGAVDAIFAAAWPEPEEPARIRLLKNTIGVEGMESFKRGLDAKILDGILDAQERHETSLERVKELREAGSDRYAAFEPASLRGTVWAAYNAVTETADWRGDGKKVGESVLIGSRGQEKVRAFGAAMDFCKLN